MKAELFWRDWNPSMKYDLDVVWHNELLPEPLAQTA